MKVLVTGATGNVGAQVVRTLLERGADVRAFIRDPDPARSMLGGDVEFSVGDFADRASIDRALHGVDRLFLACGNVPGQVQYECAAIDAATVAGVGRVVKLSSPDPAVNSPLIFDRWHGEIEQHLAASGLETVLLRPRTYMTNLLGYALTGPEAIGFERIARELTDLAPAGDRVEFVDVPDEAAKAAMLEAGLPEFVADFIVGVFRTQRAGSMSGTTDAISDLTGREPRTIGQFLRAHAAAFGGADDPLAIAGAR